MTTDYREHIPPFETPLPEHPKLDDNDADSEHDEPRVKLAEELADPDDVHALNSQPAGKHAEDQAEHRNDEAARRRQPTAAFQAHTWVITTSANHGE